MHPLVAAIMDASGWDSTDPNPNPLEGFGVTDPPPPHRTPLEQARAHGIPQVRLPAACRQAIEIAELHAATKVDPLDYAPDPYTAWVARIRSRRP